MIIWGWEGVGCKEQGCASRERKGYSGKGVRVSL